MLSVPSKPTAMSSGAMFLKKLFDMMSSTPTVMGGWCDDGTAFEIRHPKEFARVMLPQYFKHCKFTSFVRQLNFYGFQKLKKEVLLVAHESNEKGLAFSHPHFLLHKPHLMHKIKRKTNYSEADGASASTGDDFDELRNEVSEIKTTLSALSGQLSQLTQMVANLTSAAPPPQHPPSLLKGNSLMDALSTIEEDDARMNHQQRQQHMQNDPLLYSMGFPMKQEPPENGTIYQC
ncbi:Aste57867_9487 [Aphanomyces stellatus]|uniref:Aste57867_9487 protein n=1 Tax=Aphanomyces stellatus TaxID=120398 RepID=A0A485KNH9_9STRA|nr:hypothetical protein As57867_009450 [Aphanomyces stellatus]VFT86366.1 Aste57867_9487 [Aphanomyces stellatus]